MSKTKKIYIAVNLLIILAAVLLFINNYIPYISVIFGTKQYLIFFFASVCAVHIIKATRLYIALYGTGIGGKEYIKTYCKVTPISIIFPFKLGELFRIYCYGYLIKDYAKGTVIVLLDRFMDTAALVSIVVLMFVMNRYDVSIFIYILMLFLLSLLLIYKNFPNFYKFWKKYNLSAKASSKNLAHLKQLETANNLYSEVKDIIKGRGMVLFLLSLAAWVVEICNLILISKAEETKNLNIKISEYLLSALGLEQSAEFINYTFLSITILIAVYLFIKSTEIIDGKKGRKQ